jgi:histidine triad (HIT) family protein
MGQTCLSKEEPDTEEEENSKMEEDCIFCRIIAGKVPGEILYQDEEVVVLRDINPKAPIHLLIVSKKHIPSLFQITQAESPLIGHMVTVANELAKQEGVSEKGYRLIINCGREGGQLVPHLHMHFLAGHRLSDEMG